MAQPYKITNDFENTEYARIGPGNFIKILMDNNQNRQLRRNINDFANKLIYFIENKSKKDELSLEARCYAEKNLNWKDRDSQINEIFLHTQYLELDNEISIKCKEYSNRYSINLKKIELLKALVFFKNLFKVFK